METVAPLGIFTPQTSSSRRAPRRGIVWVGGYRRSASSTTMRVYGSRARSANAGVRSAQHFIKFSVELGFLQWMLRKQIPCPHECQCCGLVACPEDGNDLVCNSLVLKPLPVCGSFRSNSRPRKSFSERVRPVPPYDKAIDGGIEIFEYAIVAYSPCKLSKPIEYRRKIKRVNYPALPITPGCEFHDASNSRCQRKTRFGR